MYLHMPVVFRGEKLFFFFLNSALQTLRYTHAAERKGGGGEIPAPPFRVSIIYPLDVVLGGNAPGVQRRGESLRELLGAINVRLLVLALKANLEDLCLLLGRI